MGWLCLQVGGVVQVVDGVCGICGKSHTSVDVSVVYRHSQLTPVFDWGDGVDFRVTVI